MKSSTVEMIMQIDTDETLPLARMLILLDTFSNKNSNGTINGITKLAIYVFLLKYPYAMYKMIENEIQYGKKVPQKYRFSLEDYETNSIEVQMMPLNFAPWDYKYRRELSLLEAQKLINITIEKKKVVIGITNKGKQIVNRLLENYFYSEIKNKSMCIKSIYGNLSERKLSNLIYIAFPEILKGKVELDVTI